MDECPSIIDTVSMATPAEIASVAQVCLAFCIVNEGRLFLSDQDLIFLETFEGLA